MGSIGEIAVYIWLWIYTGIQASGFGIVVILGDYIIWSWFCWVGAPFLGFCFTLWTLAICGGCGLCSKKYVGVPARHDHWGCCVECLSRYWDWQKWLRIGWGRWDGPGEGGKLVLPWGYRESPGSRSSKRRQASPVGLPQGWGMRLWNWKWRRRGRVKIIYLIFR